MNIRLFDLLLVLQLVCYGIRWLPVRFIKIFMIKMRPFDWLRYLQTIVLVILLPQEKFLRIFWITMM